MRILYQELKRLIKKKLVEIGVDKEASEEISCCFSTADLYGVSSHGVSILPTHYERIIKGGYNLHPLFKVVKEGPAFKVIDGENSIGVISALNCVYNVVEGAKKSGIFSVNSFNNNTFGPAFYYALKIANEGLIGIVSCNSPAQMTVPNGKEKLLGTNPISIAIPNLDRPIILDMATSAVAKSKIKQFKETGKKIPLGWAIDENFQPTQDAEEALKGYVLPMAGYKGYGLAMMIDVLAGALSGAAYLDNVGRFYSPNFACMNVGFSFIAIDPKQVYGENFNSLIKSYVERVEFSRKLNNEEEILLPGFDRLKNRENNYDSGIEISDDIYQFLISGRRVS